MASISDFSNTNKRIAILKDCQLTLFDDIGKTIKSNYGAQFYKGQALMTFGVDNTPNGDFIRVEFEKGNPYHLDYNVLKNAIIDGKVAIYKGISDDIDTDFTNSIIGKSNSLPTKPKNKGSLTTCLIIGGILIAGIWYWNKKKN